MSESTTQNPLTQSQLERYPPWSCRGCDCCCTIVLNAMPCYWGLELGAERHQREDLEGFEYYCVGCEEGGLCSCDLPVEDCLTWLFLFLLFCYSSDNGA